MLVRDDLDLYEAPSPESDEARDWLRQELVCWPYVTARMQRFLDALHWRQRGSVTLTFGQGLPQADAAYKLGVSERTVRRDVYDVAQLAAAFCSRSKDR